MEVLVVPAEPEEPDGPEVVRKTASHPDERVRLLREAEVLRAAAERGVTGLPAVIAAPPVGASNPSLVTVAVAGPSLAVAAPLPVLEVAGVVAEVARVLAGLHEVGLVHGGVDPSHVVLDGAGGAILVGLGDGGPVGGPSPDPAHGPLDPAADIAAWGALVSHLLDWSATGEHEPLVALRRSLADRRPRRGAVRPLPGKAGEHERRVLAALADQAQDPDPARRPSARSLAAAVTHRIPEARVPGAVGIAPPARATGLLDRLAAHVVTPSGQLPVSARRPAPRHAVDVTVTDGPPPARRRRRALRRARAATPPARAQKSVPDVTQASVTAGSATLPGRPSPRAHRQAARRSPGSSPALRVMPSHARETPGASADEPELSVDRGAAPGARSTAPWGWSRPWLALATAAGLLAALVVVAAARTLESSRAAPGVPPPAACAPAAPPAADVDGDGCEEPVAWVEGVIQAGSARFALGGPGDAWAVGDWDCDGRRTPALLHEGTLTVFDTWPAPGAELQGHLVATAGGATGLAAVPGPDGCDRPSVLPPDADLLPVKARSP